MRWPRGAADTNFLREARIKSGLAWSTPRHMRVTMEGRVTEQTNRLNMNRRRALQCMAWGGTGVLWTVTGGVPRTLGLIGDAAAAEVAKGQLTFVQISDTHLGFKQPANPNPAVTLGEVIDKIK